MTDVVCEVFGWGGLCIVTVAVKIKFTFRNRRTIVQRSFYGSENGVKLLLRQRLSHRFYGTQA